MRIYSFVALLLFSLYSIFSLAQVTEQFSASGIVKHIKENQFEILINPGARSAKILKINDKRLQKYKGTTIDLVISMKPFCMHQCPASLIKILKIHDPTKELQRLKKD